MDEIFLRAIEDNTAALREMTFAFNALRKDLIQEREVQAVKKTRNNFKDQARNEINKWIEAEAKTNKTRKA